MLTETKAMLEDLNLTGMFSNLEIDNNDEKWKELIRQFKTLGARVEILRSTGDDHRTVWNFVELFNELMSPFGIQEHKALDGKSPFILKLLLNKEMNIFENVLNMNIFDSQSQHEDLFDEAILSGYQKPNNEDWFIYDSDMVLKNAKEIKALFDKLMRYAELYERLSNGEFKTFDAYCAEASKKNMIFEETLLKTINKYSDESQLIKELNTKSSSTHEFSELVASLLDEYLSDKCQKKATRGRRPAQSATSKTEQDKLNATLDKNQNEINKLKIMINAAETEKTKLLEQLDRLKSDNADLSSGLKKKARDASRSDFRERATTSVDSNLVESLKSEILELKIKLENSNKCSKEGTIDVEREDENQETIGNKKRPAKIAVGNKTEMQLQIENRKLHEGYEKLERRFKNSVLEKDTLIKRLRDHIDVLDEQYAAATESFQKSQKINVVHTSRPHKRAKLQEQPVLPIETVPVALMAEVVNCNQIVSTTEDTMLKAKRVRFLTLATEFIETKGKMTIPSGTTILNLFRKEARNVEVFETLARTIVNQEKRDELFLKLLIEYLGTKINI